jgi:hypothetical protein
MADAVTVPDGMCQPSPRATWSIRLWPFTPHLQNQVSWLAGSGGLRFGDHGRVLSSGTFDTFSSQEGPCSLEMWL